MGYLMYTAKYQPLSLLEKLYPNPNHARIYSAALEIFRGRAWRAGIDRKLSIIRETYAMLNAESQAARAEVLEIAIVVLIVAEIVLAMVTK